MVKLTQTAGLVDGVLQKKDPRSLAKRIKRCQQLQEMLENWPKSKLIASLEMGTYIFTISKKNYIFSDKLKKQVK